MSNLKGIRIGSSMALLLALSSTAQGQNAARTTDSTGVRGRAAADSALNGHNWFVSLLRKIARKSDETGLGADTISMGTGGSTSEASATDAGASDVVATEAPS